MGAGGRRLTSKEVSDENMIQMVDRWTKFPVLEDDAWSAKSGRLSEYLAEFKKSEALREDSTAYWVDTVKFGSELMKVPMEFRNAF